MASQTIGTMQLKWNNPLRAGVTEGMSPKGSRSSDGVTDWTKKGEQRRLGGDIEQGTKHREADRGWTGTEQDLKVTSLKWLR